MDLIRQGELARIMLKHVIREKGLHLTRDNKRNMGNLAKEIGVSHDELKQFTKIISQEILDEFFNK